MGRLRIMNGRGDSAVTWDTKRAEAGDLEALEAIRQAERLFEAERAKGSAAYSVMPNSAPMKTEHFDQTAEQIVMVPRIAGG